MNPKSEIPRKECAEVEPPDEVMQVAQLRSVLQQLLQSPPTESERRRQEALRFCRDLLVQAVGSAIGVGLVVIWGWIIGVLRKPPNITLSRIAVGSLGFLLSTLLGVLLLYLCIFVFPYWIVGRGEKDSQNRSRATGG
jgi:hypothetical protein